MFLISFYSFIPCLSLTVIKASKKQIIKLHNVQRESTVSPHDHITTSPHNHITTSPHYYPTTQSHHHITTSLYHRMITSPHHYSTTQSCILQTGGHAQHTMRSETCIVQSAPIPSSPSNNNFAKVVLASS